MFAEIEALNDSTVTRGESDALDVRTPATPWAYGCLLDLAGTASEDPSIVGVRVRVEVEVLSGSIGLFLADSSAQRQFGREVFLGETAGRVTVEMDAAGQDVRRLCIRTGVTGPSHVRVHEAKNWVRRRFDITNHIADLLPVMLRHPGEVALRAIAQVLSSTLGRPISVHEIGALACTRIPLRVDLSNILADRVGSMVLEETDRLIKLLPTYDSSKMKGLSGYLDARYFETFLRQSTIRVCHLIEQLHALGVTGGTVLEVGALLGQFAMPLRRLGYEVTVVDRYRAYDGAFAGFVSHLRQAGVNVIETDRDDETGLMARLGQFDAVISMAVVEHIPHTPRSFLQALATHVRPGGVLAMDTPNIARYWNRRRLNAGESIHQAINDQFHSSVPFEGHHREYTASEARWMLEQVGCGRVRTRLFDYNLLQFDELWADHVHSLLDITVDPTLADTVLVAGVVSGPSAIAP